MLVFWISITLISALTLWLLWRPLNSHSTLEMESVQQRNVAIANERAKEINSAFDTGDISETERDQAMQDLELSLADELATSHELKDQFSQASSSSTWIVLALVPLLAYGSYQLTNNHAPEAMKVTEAVSFGEVLHHLKQVVAANPEDQQGLLLLAQAYARLERYAESASTYKNLIQISEPDADLLVNYVDTSAMANGRRFNEEYATLLNHALSLDPRHLSGLWLSGLVEQQLGRPENALRRWLEARPLVASDPNISRDLERLIDDVSTSLGPRAQTMIAESSRPGPKALTSAGITVLVSLSPDLRSQVQDSDTVFIFARAQSGPPMPLAAARQSVTTLPLTVTLDDSMAMMPQMKLSSFTDIVVGARISKSGQATAQSGDLESELVTTVNNHPETIELVISKRRP